MNIVINKDISKIKETVFFGLPLKETVLGGITLAIGVISHHLMYEYVINDRLLYMLTAICCVPTGFLTFGKYQNMSGDQLIVEYFRSFFLRDMILTGENSYSNNIKELVKVREKEGLKSDKAVKKLKNKERRKETKLQKSQKSAGHNPVQ